MAAGRQRWAFALGGAVFVAQIIWFVSSFGSRMLGPTSSLTSAAKSKPCDPADALPVDPPKYDSAFPTFDEFGGYVVAKHPPLFSIARSKQAATDVSPAAHACVRPGGRCFRGGTLRYGRGGNRAITILNMMRYAASYGCVLKLPLVYYEGLPPARFTVFDFSLRGAKTDNVARNPQHYGACSPSPNIDWFHQEYYNGTRLYIPEVASVWGDDVFLAERAFNAYAGFDGPWVHDKKCPGNLQEDDAIVIQVRSGDVFSNHPHKLYWQPSYDYYLKTLSMRRWKQIVVFAEDEHNPVVGMLQKLEDKISGFSDSSLERSLEVRVNANISDIVFNMACARNIVVAHSSMSAMWNTSINNQWIIQPWYASAHSADTRPPSCRTLLAKLRLDAYKWDRSLNRTHTIGWHDGTYKDRDSEWRANSAQKYKMLTFAGVKMLTCATPTQISRPRGPN